LNHGHSPPDDPGVQVAERELDPEDGAMDGRFFAFCARALLGFSLVFSVALSSSGCSDGDLWPTVPTPPSSTSVSIQLTGEPQIAYISQTGKTNVIVQFIARDQDGMALTTDEVQITLLLDAAPVDNESVLQADAEELTASIHLGLVLDASYSMLLHDPPAFMPMLEAARDAVLAGQDLYAGRAGEFTWDLTWFNEVLYYPGGVGRNWVPADIVTIPAPGPGTATKLFAAVTHHARLMTTAHATVANGPHDHHIMVVFSDGADNYSWFDNSHLGSQGITSSGAQFQIAGFHAATIDTAVAAITAHPGLTTYVIGLGSEIRDDQLQPIAAAGNGSYFKNPSSSQVDALFELVTREFATIQTHGATIPLPPGDYTFHLRVATNDGRAVDEQAFAFRGGDGDAGLLR
jgi:hypothetical protein